MYMYGGSGLLSQMLVLIFVIALAAVGLLLLRNSNYNVRSDGFNQQNRNVNNQQGDEPKADYYHCESGKNCCNCGNEIDPEWKVCPFCATPLKKRV